METRWLLAREFESSYAGLSGRTWVGFLAAKLQGTPSIKLDSWEADIKRYQDSSSELMSDNINLTFPTPVLQ